MAKREIQAGDYFLLPYAGPRRNRIVKAIQPHPVGGGQWYASNERGHTTTVLLSGCQRISPSLVARICKTGGGVPPVEGSSRKSVLDECATCDDTGTTNLGAGPQPCPICKPDAYGVQECFPLLDPNVPEGGSRYPDKGCYRVGCPIHGGPAGVQEDQRG